MEGIGLAEAEQLEAELADEEVDEPLGLRGERQAGTEWRNRMRFYFLEH